ncbi:unnamed protein product [Rotaria magnacalcarata]|uniref:tRNA modification GTPase GTPBP3, mitochondrial n=1 Tax=Rotaria magnacalcarata TaxID=392030 RepID=A0A8S2KRX8_9BILA|nr:unnamed protein product [Rotaria magnacalcarata]
MIFKHFRIYKNICFCRHSSSLSTIFALATGPQLRSGVAIIRVSGSLATQSLLKLTRETKLENFKPKQLYLKKIYHHKTNDLIDQCMTVWFKEPKSFTGEDVVEFHIHGSKAVAGAIFSTLSSFPNYRLAEPGEFSKRAYLNGRLDLTEAEGLIDLINAQTEQQRKQSLYQMQGSLKELYERWRLDLVKSLAHAEAYIDFHEDQHIENDILSDVINTVKTAYNAMSIHLQDHRRGEILRDGCRIAILGAPNAGKIDKHLSDLFTIKSSSFNSLTKLILLNKIDLTNENIRLKFQQLNDNIIPISCTLGVNIEEFLSKLTKSIAEKCTEPSFTTPYLTNERHRIYLTRTVDDLLMFLTFINNNQDLVLAVEYLRLAIRSLGTVTGVVHTEELLDVIFRDFCIGK